MKILFFQDLRVWQNAHKLTLEIYQYTRKFPQNEIFSLTAQLRRSASSVSANIAEGFWRETTKEFIRFLYNSRGSIGETINHLILAKDLEYIDDNVLTSLTERYQTLAKSINSLIKSLRLKK